MKLGDEVQTCNGMPYHAGFIVSFEDDGFITIVEYDGITFYSVLPEYLEWVS